MNRYTDKDENLDAHFQDERGFNVIYPRKSAFIRVQIIYQ